MSPALLQANCALSALPPSRLPGLPATLAVLRYSRVVLAIVSVSRLPGFTTYCACSSPVSPGVFVSAIVLAFTIILVLKTFLSLLLVV